MIATTWILARTTMTSMNRQALAGMLAAILVTSSGGLSAAAESGMGAVESRAETGSPEAPGTAGHQQISQADYEQFMTCVGRFEAGIAAMKLVRSHQNTTDFDDLISAGEGQILPVNIEFARILSTRDLGLDVPAGNSARRVGRDIFDKYANDINDLGRVVRNTSILTTQCGEIFATINNTI